MQNCYGWWPFSRWQRIFLEHTAFYQEKWSLFKISRGNLVYTCCKIYETNHLCFSNIIDFNIALTETIVVSRQTRNSFEWGFIISAAPNCILTIFEMHGLRYDSRIFAVWLRTDLLSLVRTSLIWKIILSRSSFRWPQIFWIFCFWFERFLETESVAQCEFWSIDGKELISYSFSGHHDNLLLRNLQN